VHLHVRTHMYGYHQDTQLDTTSILHILDIVPYSALQADAP